MSRAVHELWLGEKPEGAKQHRFGAQGLRLGACGFGFKVWGWPS